MKCCGVEITGSEVILVSVEKLADGSFKIIPSRSARIVLRDSSDQGSVRSFYGAISAFVKTHGVTDFAVRGRNTKGEFAGGAMTFKIEGLIQVVDGCSTVILHPTTIAASKRKHGFEVPKDAFKYQTNAFQAACCFMLK
ncbi:DUF3010 domain-containing protein [Bradyrhizobium sp. Leo170]|nr:DUF3010 domain-containing protein [Bradyrhizobium sp. Leo170]